MSNWHHLRFVWEIIELLSNEPRMARFGRHLSKLWSIHLRCTRIPIMGIHCMSPFWLGKRRPLGMILNSLEWSFSQLSNGPRRSPFNCRLTKLWSIYRRWTWIAIMSIRNVGPFWSGKQCLFATFSNLFKRSISLQRAKNSSIWTFLNQVVVDLPKVDLNYLLEHSSSALILIRQTMSVWCYFGLA
jgi:hypothetical protein